MTESHRRLSELLAALSLAADLGTGMPMETTLRVCLLATRLAESADVGPDDVSATFYTGLLWSSGCTSTAHEETVRFGDDIGLKRAMAGADFERPPDVMRRATRIGAAGRGQRHRRAEPGGPACHRGRAGAAAPQRAHRGHPGASHVMHLDNPQATVRAIEGFLGSN